MDILVLGDTGTGKSTTVRDMVANFNCGSFHTCEKTTLSGLVGGVTNLQKTPFVVWGIFPINDRGLVVLDEMSGLEQEVIEKLSGVREDGVAETITVEGSMSAKARCRKIWLGNPRSRRKLAAYNSGVLAVEELFGKPEDVSRLDLVIVCASNDVSNEAINKRFVKFDERKVKYTKEGLMNKLIMWAWSRQPHEIIFSDDALDSILEWSIQMSKDFSEDFPLVIGSKQRLKIARVAIATAALLHSTTNQGKNIFVNEKHVSFAVNFMYNLFSNNNLGYKQFSQLRTVGLIEEGKVRLRIKKIDNFNLFVNSMLSGYSFTVQDIKLLMGTHDKEDAENLIHFLLVEKCLVRGKGCFFKTASFNKILGDISNESK